MTAFRTALESINPMPIAMVDPNYDDSQTYMPRSLRPEWTPVGLLGKVCVRDNGTCVVGQKCDCLNGVAVPGSKWRVLARKDTDVIQILYMHLT